MKVSLFENSFSTTPSSYISFEQLVDMIKSEELKEKTERYRTIVDETEKTSEVAKNYKKNFSAFSACELIQRDSSPENLQLYDGYIIIDIDDISEDKIKELQDALAKERHVVMYYVSVSKTGLKVIHSTDYQQEDVVGYHLNCFENLKQWYKTNLNIEIDKACKDYVRMSYIAYDEEVYYNVKHTPISIKPIEKVALEITQNEYKPTNNAVEIINDIYAYLMKNKLVLTNTYDEWLSLCFALKFELSEGSARHWLHQFSSLDPKTYNRVECDEKIKNCQITRDKSYTIGTIIYLAQKTGYRITNKFNSSTGYQLKKLVATHALQERGIQIRFNELTQELEYHYRSKEEFKNSDLGVREWYKLTDIDLNHLYLEVLNNQFDKKKCREYLTVTVKRHNPVKDFIDSIPEHDGGEYIKALSKTIVADCNEEVLEMMLRKWLVAFVGMLSDPMKCINENILVLQGGQGMGKTRWVRKLARPFIEYFTSKNINPDNKDDRFLTAENFLILFDEMENMVSTKSNMEAFKALLSETQFTARRPYERITCTSRRIASYIGTINRSGFLRDTTGNRRYFVVPCEKINYQHNIDMTKVYSEALHLYKTGYRYYLNSEEQRQLDVHNEEFEEECLEKELLNKWIEPDSSNGMNTTEILQGLKEREGDLITCKVAFIGRLLNSMGYKRKTINGRKAYPVKFKEELSNYKIVITKDKVVSLF